MKNILLLLAMISLAAGPAWADEDVPDPGGESDEDEDVPPPADEDDDVPPPDDKDDVPPPTEKGDKDDNEDEDDEDKDDNSNKRTYAGDANSGWGHIGGGFGAMDAASLTLDGINAGTIPQGRIVLGGGGYTFGFFGGGGVDLTFSEVIPFRLDLYGVLGVHIPIPVVHPLLGIKGGIGFGMFSGGSGTPSPVVNVGAQLGTIIRDYDRKLGIRLMADPGVLIIVDPTYGALVGAEFIFSVAFVY